MEHAVDAEADHQGVCLGIEVDVARSVLGRLEKNGVDEANEGGVGDAVVRLEVVGLFVRRVEPDRVGQARAASELRSPGEAAELVLDLLACRHSQRNRLAAGESERVDAVDILRIGDGDAERLAVERIRDCRHLLQDA